MPVRLDSAVRQSLSWWLPVLFLALLLKQHYSVADAMQLQWILRPLAELLGLMTGNAFQRNSNGEWFSISADVRLVKSCAGVNFLLMSLLAYAWVLRPDRRERTQTLVWFGAHLLSLVTISIAAWSTALAANLMRILLAMNLQVDHSIVHAFGLNDSEIHRFIGLAVYLPLLSLQLMAAGRVNRRQVILIPVLLYFLLMVFVPMLNGNAWRNPGLFFTHLLQLGFACALFSALLYLLMLDRRPQPRSLRRHGRSFKTAI